MPYLLFCTSRNTDLKYMHCTSLVVTGGVLQSRHILYEQYSYIASCHFMAISTSYLNAAGFLNSFFHLL